VVAFSAIIVIGSASQDAECENDENVGRLYKLSSVVVTLSRVIIDECSKSCENIMNYHATIMNLV
jgi:hypothetical protein